MKVLWRLTEYPQAVPFFLNKLPAVGQIIGLAHVKLRHRMRVRISKTKIDGGRSTSILWRRFNSSKTTATGGTKLFRDSILENVVNYTVPAPSTDRDAVEQIARQSEQPIPIEPLPDVLNEKVACRGRVLFGLCG